MFEFLFGKKPTKKSAPETLRQTAERSLKELNAVLATLPEQPAITVRGAGAGVEIDWPKQMPDEAKALPAPEPESDADAAPKTERVDETAASAEPDETSETKAA